MLGGLDWAAPSFGSGGTASTDLLETSNSSMLAESGVFSALDARKLSREKLNEHWNNLPTTVRDAVFGPGYTHKIWNSPSLEHLISTLAIDFSRAPTAALCLGFPLSFSR